MENTQSTIYTDSGIKLQNSDENLPTNLVVYDASGKKTSVTIEGDLYVAGKIKSADDTTAENKIEEILPTQAGQAGKFLETNGTSVFWDTVNQVPTPSGSQQLLNSTGAGTYAFSSDPTVNIIRTASGSNGGLRILDSNNGIFGSSSNNSMSLLTGNVTRQFWDSNGSTLSVPLSCTGNISFTGNNGQMRRTDNVNINLYEEGFTRQISLNVGSNPATRRRLFINDNVFTVENSRFVVSETAQTHSIAGQLNLNTVGSSTAPALLFGDTTGPSGIYGSDNVINFCTDGTERMRIGQNFNDHYQAVTTNQRFQSPDGDGNGYRFANSGDNRIVCNTNTVSIRSNGVNTLSVTNTGATVNGDLTVTGRATIPDVVYPFDVFTSTGSTADFTLAQSTRSNVRLEMDTFNTILRFPALVEGTFYRIVPFRNGTTATLSFRPGNNVIMYMYSGGSRSQVTGNAGGTNGHSVLPGTFYECIFSGGAWYVVAQHPISTCALPSDVNVGGNLTVTGTISGNYPSNTLNVLTVQFGGQDTSITGANSGSNSSVNIRTEQQNRVNIKSNDTEIVNTLRLLRAPIIDAIILDSGTHTISRTSPSKIILSKTFLSTSADSVTVVFPPTVSNNPPDNLKIEIVVLNIPGRQGTGSQYVRFTTDNAIIVGPSGNSTLTANTLYTVNPGTRFTAYYHFTTVNCWVVEAIRFSSFPALSWS